MSTRLEGLVALAVELSVVRCVLVSSLTPSPRPFLTLDGPVVRNFVKFSPGGEACDFGEKVSIITFEGVRFCCTHPRHVSFRVDVVALDVDASIPLRRRVHDGKDADFALGQLRTSTVSVGSGIGGHAPVPVGPPSCIG